MTVDLVDDLRDRIGRGRVVVVAGSGVTASATRGNELSSWSGLIDSGLEHAETLGGAEQGLLDAARSLLGVGNSSALISAAELVTDMLGGRVGGEYARWLRETVGSLKLVDPAVPEALMSLGAPVATTNYDDLLREASSGWERVTWLDGSAVQRALQGDDSAVVHLHGHWREPHSVVLGVKSYEEMGHSGPAQGLQRAMATMNSMLFVGVGDGASDPNFGALRKWLARTFPDSQYRHFRLCLNSQVAELRTEHDHEERIVPVGYGDSHEDLADFLRSVATAPRGHRQAPHTSGAAGEDGAALPAPPVTLGREDRVEEAVARLLMEPPKPVLLHGAPGIGKTNLTLAALHNPEVVARFEQRRWMAQCETAKSAAGLAGELAATLGVPPGGDALGRAVALLSRAPAVLALDNLETPWERDTLAVEELLGRVASVPEVALIASVRGLERPSGVRWGQPIQLEPLALPAARGLFTSIAPEDFDTPALDDLLEEMGGVPLAVELLAYAADGEPDLDHLAERWRKERARLLKRGQGDHRLLNIAVSVDTSWNSPAMTDAAKQLLSILGGLPDGVADDDLEALLPGEGPAAANLLRRRGLALEQAGRLRTLPPVRHHLADAHPPTESDWQHTIAHYRARSAKLGARAGKAGGDEAISTLAREAANITVAIEQILEREQPDQGYVAAQAFIEAARFSGIDAAPIVEALLRAAEHSDNTKLLADANFRAGILAFARSDHDAARGAYTRAQTLYDQIGDVLGQANCIHALGDTAHAQSDHDAARGAYNRAQPMYEQVGDVLGQANCIKGFGDIALERADHDAARDAYTRAQPLYDQIGDVLGQANCIGRLGDIALAQSDHDAARDAYTRAQPLYKQIGSVRGQANCVQRLGDTALAQSDHDAARDAYTRAQPLYKQIGDVLGQANCIQSLGDIALAQSDLDAAHDAYEKALTLYTGIAEPYSIGMTHRRLARLEKDSPARCAHVSEARKAWLSIKRGGLVAELAAEFPDCV